MNTEFFKPVNLLIIGVVALIWVSTAGKFFSSHVQKESAQ